MQSTLSTGQRAIQLESASVLLGLPLGTLMLSACLFLLGATHAVIAQDFPPLTAQTEYERWQTELSNWSRWGPDDEIGVEIEMCPSTSGFKSWRAMALSPLTNALYIPLTLNCELAPPQDRNLVGAIGSDAQETLASRARSQRYREVVVGDYPPPSWGSSRSKYLGGNPVRIRNTMPRLCSRSTRLCSSDVTGTAR